MQNWDLTLEVVLIFPSFSQPFDRWRGNIPGFVCGYVCSKPFSFSKNEGTLRNQLVSLHKLNTYWFSGQETGRGLFYSTNPQCHVVYTAICL